MIATFQILLFFLAVLVIVALIAERLKMAPSILLVLAGVALAFVPGLPRINLSPEFVLYLLLPPLIYSAGVAMSWREFRYNLRPIALLAFGCVVFTTCAVAAALHYVLGWQWGVAFVLGAIVAPPDVVAPLAVARRLRLPRRLLVVLEGEGLANDATALILYRFAVAAVSMGVFSLPQAAATFGLIVVGEILYGTGVGWMSLRLRQWAHNPRAEITLSLMTPYIAYWLPLNLGGSGVLATVAAGLYVSWNGPRLISGATRLQGIFFWDLIVYLIEGFLFLLTGLQARVLWETAQSFSLRELVVATLLVTAVAIVARFAWVFPAAYVPRWISPSLRERDPYPSWQLVFMLSFTGVRGVVSLAAALAIPLTIENTDPFPQRDLILFVAFGAIVITLVGQGLMLPLVMRWLKLAGEGEAEQRREREAELAARAEAIREAHRHLDTVAAERKLGAAVVEFLEARHQHRLRQVPATIDEAALRSQLNDGLRLELIAAERTFLHDMLRQGKITDESRRRLERELDLEESAILSNGEGDTPL
ncbi:MAG: Na+/H+ antiporter [Alphaproteobacteria bacterium]|nr:Na+/H+ antiporter [Alphaproteobacteria bacterium]